jgi:coronin-7
MHISIEYFYLQSEQTPSRPSKEVDAPTPSAATPSSVQEDSSSSETPETYKKPHKTFSNLYHSKYRHVKGSALHRSQYIENVRNLNNSIFGECDGFQSNTKRAAIALDGPGGKIAVLEVC